jgi:quinoprotein glucose dehydrogenase
MATPEADGLLAEWLDKLLVRQVPPELQLDLLEAAVRRSTAEIKEKLACYEASCRRDNPVALYREALAGGDAEVGQKIFYTKAEVSCPRCHKIKGEGGEVGPALDGIGARQSREYLLAAVVDPNRDIARGFETVVVTLKNGQVHFGIVKAEDGEAVCLMTPEGKSLRVPKAQIQERQRGKSAMPEDLTRFLSKTDVRDLVEFLAGLK